MKYQYKATGSFRRKVTECEAVDTLPEAMRQAHDLAPKNKVVTILRADCEGINAGKFFLHLILK